MRLKSLEIKGFKSFANPITLHFDENVTGVVGPNGSGKSNVVDAFRWVLGEQKSKDLRLEQMGDVLFNGTKAKKQANLAEVSIIFDNTKNILPTEFNTVKISRRLYRNGDSEYLINETVCRLKDIHTLLMDTGIGSNSYSIIELGMVDDILHDKEDARRRMFEQAAGISKFKKRKKETIQKLMLTNADLERVEDLLFEIQTNLKELEKQARRTKRYFSLKDKYRESSIKLSALKWNSIEESIKNLEQQIQENKKLFNDETVLINKLESKLEKEKKQNLTEERNLSEFQKSINQILDEIRQLENDKNLTNQKLEYSKNSIAKAREDISKTEPSIKQVKAELKSLDFEMENKKDKLSKEVEAFIESEERLNEVSKRFSNNKNAQQSKNVHFRKLQNDRFEIEKGIAIISNKLESLNNEILQNNNKVREIKENLVAQLKEHQSIKQKLKLINNEIKGLLNKEENRQDKISEVEEQIQKGLESLAKINRKIDARENELKLLKSMVENFEGFPESVKFLHSKWDGDKILLSDVINCEEVYRTAVEQFFFPYLGYFIVTETKDAEKAISILQKNQKGKANFFILDQVEDVKPNPDIPFKPLNSVIEVDEKYVKLIRLLSQNVFILPEKEVYKDEIFKENPGIALIDHTGAVLRGKHYIIGGSLGLFEGKKLGRKKRIDNLKKLLEKDNAEKVKIERSVDQLRADIKLLKQNDFKNQIKLKENEKFILDKSFSVLELKLENADKNISELKTKNDSINAEFESSKNEEAKLKTSNLKIESEINNLQHQLSKEDDVLEELNSELEQSRKAYNEQNIAKIQSENLLAALVKEKAHKQNKFQELAILLEDAEKTLDKEEKALTLSKERLNEIENILLEKYALRDSNQTQLSEAENEFFKARGKVSTLEDEIRKCSKKMNDQQFVINQLKDKLTDCNFKKTSIKDRIKIEFDIQFEKVKDEIELEMYSEAELELKVEKHRKRIENYGEINPMALEAYDEMEKRNQHIIEQRDDIIDAKTSLMNTIGEIEETATKMFQDSFDAVRKHFKVVFRSLFTRDDNCDLLLETPEDPLNSKIEIIARPKGKRPKSLSQLSGGEKTLTATALLFSLYLLKPAPFCIFDEVDAPLDDNNIQKFSNIIRAFSDKSQFIIVTHNKSTMAEVDILYGIYMQKQGVSSVSPVDFRSFEDKGNIYNSTLNTVN